MEKIIIQSDNAPAPIGPYNQAVESKGTLYVSGQIALIPGTDNLVIDSITNETHQVMKNIKAILEAANMGFENIVKTSIFLTDMKFFQEMNTTYATYFNENFPARETVHVVGLPKGVNVEISVIAVR